MDIRIRGTRAEVDALLPGLLRGGLQVRNLYGGRDGMVAVYLEPDGTSLPSAQFQEQATVQAAPSARRAPQPALSRPLPALPAGSGESSLRDHFKSLGLDVPSPRWK